MLDKLEAIEQLYNELTEKMADPKLAQDRQEYQKVGKRRSELEEIVEAYHRYKDIQNQIEGAKELLRETTDPELRELAEVELEELEETLASTESELKMLLLPKDPNDEKNVIVEIRAGTGGDEAALFAGTVCRNPLPHVQPLRRRPPLEARGFKRQRYRAWRIQRDHLYDRR